MNDTFNQSDPRPLPERPKKPPSDRMFVGIYWSVVVVILVIVVWRLITGTMSIRFEGPWLAGFGMLAFVGVVMFRVGRVRIVRAFLRPHAGFVCPRCLYPLRKLPDVGRCPECGTDYTREGVVTLWERAYHLGYRYPRHGPSFTQRRVAGQPALAPDSPEHAKIEEPVRSVESPWSRAGLQPALDRLEAMARARGYSSPRFARFSLRLGDGFGRLGGPVPHDLYLFLSWFDPALWSCVVSSGAVTPSGVDVDSSASHQIDGVAREHIAVRVPETLSVTPGPPAPSPAPARKSGIKEPRPIEFADSADGQVIAYALGLSEIADGSIILTRQSEGRFVWLASSLAEWLMRLAECGGVEPLLAPSLLDSIPAATRDAYLREIRGRNANGSFFVGARAEFVMPQALARSDAVPNDPPAIG